MKCQGVIVKEERDAVSPGRIDSSLYLRLPSTSSQKLNVNPRPYHQPPNQPKCCPLPSLAASLAAILCCIEIYFTTVSFSRTKTEKIGKTLFLQLNFLSHMLSAPLTFGPARMGACLTVVGYWWVVWRAGAVGPTTGSAAGGCRGRRSRGLEPGRHQLHQLHPGIPGIYQLKATHDNPR